MLSASGVVFGQLRPGVGHEKQVTYRIGKERVSMEVRSMLGHWRQWRQNQLEQGW